MFSKPRKEAPNLYQQQFFIFAFLGFLAVLVIVLSTLPLAHTPQSFLL
jgi:hypothetical protein